MNGKKILTASLIIIVILYFAYEIVIFSILYINADEVNCNWLWCEFKQQRTTIESRITRECFKNNVKVNCSDDFDYMAEDGIVNCDKYDCQPIIDYIKTQQNLSD